jgi:hypothetical protein
MENEKGVIRNKEFATQVRDFRNLKFGNITPTDLDGLIEYKNKCFVLIEVKYEGAEMPFGQGLALERLCDSISKPTILILATHTSMGDIDVGNTKVEQFRFWKKWHEPENVTTPRELVERFVTWAGVIP